LEKIAIVMRRIFLGLFAEGYLFRSKSLKYHRLPAVMRLAAAISPDVLY
jgi:hypothetical protein